MQETIIALLLKDFQVKNFPIFLGNNSIYFSFIKRNLFLVWINAHSPFRPEYGMYSVKDIATSLILTVKSYGNFVLVHYEQLIIMINLQERL